MDNSKQFEPVDECIAGLALEILEDTEMCRASVEALVLKAQDCLVSSMTPDGKRGLIAFYCFFSMC